MGLKIVRRNPVKKVIKKTIASTVKSRAKKPVKSIKYIIEMGCINGRSLSLRYWDGSKYVLHINKAHKYVNQRSAQIIQKGLTSSPLSREGSLIRIIPVMS